MPPLRAYVLSRICFAVAIGSLAGWLSACGGGGGDTGTSTAPLEPRYQAAWEELRPCLAGEGYTTPAGGPPVTYVPTVECGNGVFCCVSTNRGAEADGDTVYLPAECEGARAGWREDSYAHEAIHTALPGTDACHTLPVWGACDPLQAHGCTPT